MASGVGGWTLVALSPLRAAARYTGFKVNDVEVYAAVSGVPEYRSLEKHVIEDHGLKLRVLEGKLDPAIVEAIRDPKRAITLEEMISDIMEASPENVRKAYPHIACLIEALQERRA